jgi:hypothetical protein
MNEVNIIDIAKLFEKTLGNKPYVINKNGELSTDPGQAYQISQAKAADQLFTSRGSLLKETLKGIPVFLPVRFSDPGGLLMHLPYCVVRISGKKTVTRTALPERQGTVKELYNIDDYSISIKGFIIGQNRQFPEAELLQFKRVFEGRHSIQIDNALTNIFLDGSGQDLKQDEQRRVAILEFDLPEVQGGRLHVRPFSLSLESDHVFTLEWQDIDNNKVAGAGQLMAMVNYTGQA